MPAPSNPSTLDDSVSRSGRQNGNSSNRSSETKVALLTGGKDRPYAFGLAMALVAQNVHLHVIGSDEVDSPEMHRTRNLAFLNLHGTMRPAPIGTKILRVWRFYIRLARYAATSGPRVLHILWNNNFEWFDRTLLIMYYRILGKKIAITAHNVNAGQRDSKDSILNRATLRIEYKLAHHIFVHTRKMRDQLCEDFGVCNGNITIIRHPVNNAFPDTDLTTAGAKKRLGIQSGEKTMLCFGRLRPYKGIEYLLSALEQLSTEGEGYRLIIAGEAKKGSETYYEDLRREIDNHVNRDRIIDRIEFIPDEDAELYLKAADVMVLPYKDIYQSGVLFLAYSFGLPVVATDVGSFREEIIEGKTGFMCKPCDSSDLARALKTYFESDLFIGLDSHRRAIQEYAYAEHSWDAVAALTRKAYVEMIGR